MWDVSRVTGFIVGWRPKSSGFDRRFKWKTLLLASRPPSHWSVLVVFPINICSIFPISVPEAFVFGKPSGVWTSCRPTTWTKDQLLQMFMFKSLWCFRLNLSYYRLGLSSSFMLSLPLRCFISSQCCVATRWPGTKSHCWFLLACLWVCVRAEVKPCCFSHC